MHMQNIDRGAPIYTSMSTKGTLLLYCLKINKDMTSEQKFFS